MQFITVEDMNIRYGMPIRMMTQMTPILEREFDITTMDQMIGYKALMLVSDLSTVENLSGGMPDLSVKTIKEEGSTYHIVGLAKLSQSNKITRHDDVDLFLSVNNVGEVKVAFEPIENFDLIVSDTVPASFVKWMGEGQRGSSSDFIAKTLFGHPKKAEHAYPHDPSDFKRCHQFFEQVPEALPLFHKMEEIESTIWPGLVNQWDSLTTLYYEESHLKSSPKLYDALEKIVRPQPASKMTP